MKLSRKYNITEELRKEEFDKYFEFIKKLGIDTEEKYEEIKSTILKFY